MLSNHRHWLSDGLFPTKSITNNTQIKILPQKCKTLWIAIFIITHVCHLITYSCINSVTELLHSSYYIQSSNHISAVFQLCLFCHSNTYLTRSVNAKPSTQFSTNCAPWRWVTNWPSLSRFSMHFCLAAFFSRLL